MCRVIYFVGVVQLLHGKSHLQTGIFFRPYAYKASSHAVQILGQIQRLQK